jgi:hypothetical protein
LLELRQAFVNVADVLYCADDILATVTVSKFVSGVVVRTVMFTSLLPLFLNPSREAADPRFEIHVLITSNQFGGNEGSGVMFELVFALVSTFWMTLLPEPVADLAISLPELVTDDATMMKLPEGPLQLPVSVNFLFVKP